MTGIAIQKFRPANLANVRIQQISFAVPESLKNKAAGRGDEGDEGDEEDEGTGEAGGGRNKYMTIDPSLTLDS